MYVLVFDGWWKQLCIFPSSLTCYQSMCLRLTQSYILYIKSLYSCKYTAAAIHLRTLAKHAIKPAWWCINPCVTEAETLMLAKHTTINQQGFAKSSRTWAVRTLTCVWRWVSTQRELTFLWDRLFFTILWQESGTLKCSVRWTMKGRWKSMGKLWYMQCHSFWADLRLTQTRSHTRWFSVGGG